jgi:hypothetical protein
MYADPYGLWSMDKAWGFIYDTTGWVPSQGLVNCLAGYGDYMSFGATEWLRDKTNVGGVDKCSDAYRYCTYIGMAQDAVTLARAAIDFAKAYKGYAAAKFAKHKGITGAVRDDIKAAQPVMPKAMAYNVAKDFLKNPRGIWGKTAENIVDDFIKAGNQATIRPSVKGSKKAEVVAVKNHPNISQIQVHPGGGRHVGEYYKVSTTTDGTIKVVDKATYKPTSGEKAKIIYK